MSTHSSSSSSSPSSTDDLIAQTIEQAEIAFAAAWNAISSMSPQLNALPHDVADSLNDLYNRLTNNGTLPLIPSWRDTPVAWAVESTPPPPPARAPPTAGSTSSSKFIAQHPYLFTFIAASGGLGTAYYFYPASTARVLRPLMSRLPKRLSLPSSLIRRSSQPRPARFLQEGHIETRKEAVLLLGCDSPLLADLALELESRGFVVIATVSRPETIETLERRSRGWMKVLVLDGSDATSVGPFLRSLATALSLRFPLYSSGDPFSRPAHALALTAVVNALAIDAGKSGLVPVEALDADDVRRFIGEKVAVVVGIIRGVVPILRSAAARPDAPRGVFLNLAPSTSPLSLPFVSLASASDAAISSLLTSLRRELHSTSTKSNIRVKSLSIGFFEGPSSTSPTHSPPIEPLSTRISSLYSTSLATRSSLFTRTRKGSSPKRLYLRVFNILTDSRSWTSPSNIGAGSWSYRLASSFYPTWFVDAYLRMQDWLYATYFTRRGRIASASTSSSAPPSYTAATSSSRPPLPTPPAGRSGYADEKGKSTATSSRASTTSSSEGAGSGTEDLLTSSMHEGSGLGSFVHVPPTTASSSSTKNGEGLFRQEVRP